MSQPEQRKFGTFGGVFTPERPHHSRRHHVPALRPGYRTVRCRPGVADSVAGQGHHEPDSGFPVRDRHQHPRQGGRRVLPDQPQPRRRIRRRHRLRFLHRPGHLRGHVCHRLRRSVCGDFSRGRLKPADGCHHRQRLGLRHGAGRRGLGHQNSIRHPRHPRHLYRLVCRRRLRELFARAVWFQIPVRPTPRARAS